MMEKRMALAMQRLSASREKSIDADRSFGRKLGQHWAHFVAEWPALSGVAALDSKTTFDDLKKLLVEGFGYQPEEVDGLFGRCADNDCLSVTNNEVAGFIEAARSVHRQIERNSDDDDWLIL